MTNIGAEGLTITASAHIMAMTVNNVAVHPNKTYRKLPREVPVEYFPSAATATVEENRNDRRHGMGLNL